MGVGIFFLSAIEIETDLKGNFTHHLDIRRCKKTLDTGGLKHLLG